MSKVFTVWHWLIYLSLPFILSSSFEMLILTAMHGPQMLFFSFMHGGYGPLTILIILSGIMYAVLQVSCLVLVLAMAWPKTREFVFSTKNVKIVSLIFIHFLLLITYEIWMYAIFPVIT